MTSIDAKSWTISLPNPLPGLPDAAHCQIRPLPALTLFSLANRFLRPDFPITRNEALCLQTLAKGLLYPALSKQQASHLPRVTLETLTTHVFTVSLQAMADGPDAVVTRPTDPWLSVLMALEDIAQFQLSRLVSEDLAVQEAHPVDSLHPVHFRPHPSADVLQTVLRAQGYPVMPWFAEAVLSEFSAEAAYWLARQQALAFPWQALLGHFASHQGSETFAYLARLQAIGDFLAGNPLPDLASASSETIARAAARMQQWIETEFIAFSQRIGVPKPVKTLVLAEGNTEAIILPALARVMGVDLNREGILIQSVGGKNQMLGNYVQAAEQLAVPICLVLDEDARPILPDLEYYRRPEDRIVILEQGEMEDLYAPSLMLETIQRCYQPTHPVYIDALEAGLRQSQARRLQQLWPQLGLGVFDKVTFAQNLAATMTQVRHISPGMKGLWNAIMATREAAVG